MAFRKNREIYCPYVLLHLQSRLVSEFELWFGRISEHQSGRNLKHANAHTFRVLTRWKKNSYLMIVFEDFYSCEMKNSDQMQSTERNNFFNNKSTYDDEQLRTLVCWYKQISPLE